MLTWEKATLSQSIPNLFPMFLEILCEFVAIGGFRILKTNKPAKLSGF
jgi:hypothetical protein